MSSKLARMYFIFEFVLSDVCPEVGILSKRGQLIVCCVWVSDAKLCCVLQSRPRRAAPTLRLDAMTGAGDADSRPGSPAFILYVL